MPLKSEDEKVTQKFLTRPRFILDSCVLVSAGKSDEGLRQISTLLDSPYPVIIPAPCLLEVEIGSEKDRSKLFDELERFLRGREVLDPERARQILARGGQIPKHVLYAPSTIEYENARAVLLRIAENSGLGNRRIMDLRIDVLIYFCADLFRAIIVTQNERDFDVIALHSKSGTQEKSSPILTIQQAFDSLSTIVEI
jgi:hypothetical protein